MELAVSSENFHWTQAGPESKRVCMTQSQGDVRMETCVYISYASS